MDELGSSGKNGTRIANAKRLELIDLVVEFETELV